jgi:hypothetical protein
MSMVPVVTWKSTAVVSGVGLLATWLASYAPPANLPADTAARVPAAVTAEAPDIVREANRLQAKVRAEVEYVQPSRNPFRFGARDSAPVPRSESVHTLPAAVDVAPAPIVIRLSGIAIDTVNGREERTAILNTPGGLVFVKEGEEVAGAYKVSKIAIDAVDLVRADGSLLQLR